MSALLQPQGLVPVRHPSGTIRVENQVDGITSGYAFNMFTGSPIMRGTSGNIELSAGSPNVCMGVFQGCEFTSGTKRFLLGYWPASTVYDAGSMIVRFTMDPDIIYEGQSSGPVALVDVGGGINISAVSGNTSHGFSTQTLSTPTGATAATFRIVNIAPYDDNAWGDAYTKVLVQIAAAGAQVQVAMAATSLSDEEKARREDAIAKEKAAADRWEEDVKLIEKRREEDAERVKARAEEDKKRAEEDEKRAEADAAKDQPPAPIAGPPPMRPGTTASQPSN